jgi:hypothetical protein
VSRRGGDRRTAALWQPRLRGELQGRIENTKFGSLTGWVPSVNSGYLAFLDGTESPALPLTQAPPSGPLASSIEEAVEQLRRALVRS